MGLPVGQQMEDLFRGRVHARLRDQPFLAMTQADITQSTVMAVRFSVVSEQLTTATDTFVSGIADNGGDALAELRQALFVDDWRELQNLFVLAPLGVADIWRLLLRNKMQNMALTKSLQNLIDLLWLQGRLTGKESFVDIVVVGKESTVVA